MDAFQGFIASDVEIIVNTAYTILLDGLFMVWLAVLFEEEI